MGNVCFISCGWRYHWLFDPEIDRWQPLTVGLLSMPSPMAKHRCILLPDADIYS